MATVAAMAMEEAPATEEAKVVAATEAVPAGQAAGTTLGSFLTQRLPPSRVLRGSLER